MNKILLAVFVISTPIYLRAQFINNGAGLSLSDKALIYVDMDVVNNGEIDNSGKIIAKKNWYTSNNFGGISKTSTGIVVLEGGEQVIGGANESNFPNLVLLGNGKKSLEQNVNVFQSLDLNNIELALNKKRLTLHSKIPQSLIRLNGYVSTDDGGYLYREVEYNKDYVYPMGAKDIYRPVILKLKSNQDNLVGVSFVNNDATYSLFNRDSKRSNLNEINPKYFHVINAENSNTSAQISFNHHKTEDEPYKELAAWVENYIWEKVIISKKDISDGNLNEALVFSASNINKLPFALASLNNNVNLSFYNSFSPDGDGKNDSWHIGNIDSYPDNEVTIFNRWGGEVFKTKSYSSINKWDGAGLNEGTYYYLLKVKIGDEYRVYKGFISLIKK